MSDTLYVKMDQAVELTKSEVTVADVAKFECKNQNVLNKLKPMKLFTDESNGRKRYIVSIMKIVELVDENFQNVEVQHFGETECVVEFKKAKTGKNYLEILKTIIICFILFLEWVFRLCLLIMTCL